MRRTNQNLSIGTGSEHGTSTQSSDQWFETPSLHVAKTPAMFSLRLNLCSKKEMSIVYVEKLVHLIVFIIRIYHDARFFECQNSIYPSTRYGNPADFKPSTAQTHLNHSMQLLWSPLETSFPKLHLSTNVPSHNLRLFVSPCVVIVKYTT
jgi:hypothetical protein